MTNANAVSISFGKVEEGEDARGYYKKVPGRAMSSGKDKKQKTFEIRIYYPKAKAKVDQYIPIKLRKPDYVGPKDPPALTVKDKVWVFCTCEYFLYHCEVADAEQDNSSINHMQRNWMPGGKNNGKAPIITNPNHTAHLCKHLISSLRKGALLKK